MISVQTIVLPSNLRNPKESQLTEIIQHLFQPGSKVRALYGSDTIYERHRHRYEVNNHLLPKIEAAGMKVTGRSADKKLVEIIENPDHPWFVAAQFHPEFTSTPRDGHGLFTGFIKAAGQYQQGELE